MLAKQYLGMGHCISGKTYLELAAAKGSEEAIAQLKDMEYAQDMYDLASIIWQWAIASAPRPTLSWLLPKAARRLLQS